MQEAFPYLCSFTHWLPSGGGMRRERQESREDRSLSFPSTDLETSILYGTRSASLGGGEAWCHIPISNVVWTYCRSPFLLPLPSSLSEYQHVAQAGMVSPRLASNLWCSCLCLPRARIRSVCYQAWLHLLSWEKSNLFYSDCCTEHNPRTPGPRKISITPHPAFGVISTKRWGPNIILHTSAKAFAFSMNV